MFIPKRVFDLLNDTHKKAQAEISAAQETALQQIKTVLTEQIRSSRDLHERLTDEHKNVLQAILQQNATMLDRFMAMNGKLVEYEMQRTQEEEDLRSSKHTEAVEGKTSYDDDAILKALNQIEEAKERAEEIELRDSIRTGKLNVDL